MMNRMKTTMAGKQRRRDLAEMEHRRREGMHLLEDGESQADVARELGVCRQTVSRWAKLLDEYSDQQPWRRRPVGRPSALSEGNKRQLQMMLSEDSARGLPNGRWSLVRVARLIEDEFGVAYSLVHVRSILLGMGCSLSNINYPLRFGMRSRHVDRVRRGGGIGRLSGD